MQGSFFDNLKRFDQQRQSFPGEHWLTLAAGLWFLRRPARSPLARLSTTAIGAALIYRAASGRDGLRRLWSSGGTDALRSDYIALDSDVGTTARLPLARSGGYPDFR
jgi:hypothetical protein